MTAPTASIPNSREHRLGHLDAAQRRLAHLVAVDDLAGHRLVLRRGEATSVGARLDPLADRLQQLAAARDLVQEGEDRAAVAVGAGGAAVGRLLALTGSAPRPFRPPRARARRPRPRPGR